jgi:predicted hydrocarbon binding protein
MTVSIVDVPAQFAEIFLRAEEYARRYFGAMRLEPTCGTIEVSGERYILMRAGAMSVEFSDLLAGIYSEGSELEARQLAANLLFDLGHAIGKSDARHFHSHMGITDPIERLSIGPVQFAFSGWASVKIDSSSRVMPNENYFLLYDHPYSFEADSWNRRGRKATQPVCAMNAGYSSGWCEESFGIPLSAMEITCRAMGHEACRFIMSPPWRLEEHARHYQSGAMSDGRPQQVERAARIPEFFQRKHLEDKIRRNQRHIELLISQRADADRQLAEKDQEIATLRAQLRDRAARPQESA